jgi:two-component system sensor histidine kinase KdpD
VLIVSGLLYLLSDIIGYKVVAFILLLTLSLLALVLDIVPTLLAAILSALIWDYFFIPLRYTFQVDNAEDFFLLIMYFVIVLLHAVLTFKIRQIQKIAQQRED